MNNSFSNDVAGHYRGAWLELDLAAISNNVSYLKSFAPQSELCAVVKANGYGHGAVGAALGAISGGASVLAVALVEEGIELRRAGIDIPILLLSQPPIESLKYCIGWGLIPTITSPDALDTLENLDVAWEEYFEDASPDRASDISKFGQILDQRVPVHVKVETGMNRAGAAIEVAMDLSVRVANSNKVYLDGLWTHLATADEKDQEISKAQIERFSEFEKDLVNVLGFRPKTHISNTAATVTLPDSRRDLVRCGIGIYGYFPSKDVERIAADPGNSGSLIPALSLKARISMIKEVKPNEGISYGHIYVTNSLALIATVPVGYADGVPRVIGSNSSNGSVLIRGQRCPIRGWVTMDQLTVDVTALKGSVEIGDDVVLIGSMEDEAIYADEWARLANTIVYEILIHMANRLQIRPSQHSPN
ncbi:MAG: alanine racemase [Acidimicrobiales bacterium]|nr:alanine racemase [Acidimicrobiales bacterium]